VFAESGEPMKLSKEDAHVKTFTEVEFNAAMSAEAVKLTAMTERAERAEAELAALSEKAEKDAVAAVIENAEKEGKIVPANKAAIAAMAEAIRVSVDPMKRKAALDTFTAFVAALPVKVTFGESAASDQKKIEGGSPSERADAAAKKYADEHKCTYKVALDAVFAADPELKAAYAEENR
jgi:phage I-like protein